MGVSNNYPTKKEAKTPYLLRDGCPDGLPGSGTITNLPLCCDHAGRLHLIHFDLCRPHPRRQNEERLPHGALYHLNWNQPLSQHRQHHKSHRQPSSFPDIAFSIFCWLLSAYFFLVVWSYKKEITDGAS